MSGKCQRPCSSNATTPPVAAHAMHVPICRNLCVSVAYWARLRARGWELPRFCRYRCADGSVQSVNPAPGDRQAPPFGGLSNKKYIGMFVDSPTRRPLASEIAIVS